MDINYSHEGEFSCVVRLSQFIVNVFEYLMASLKNTDFNVELIYVYVVRIVHSKIFFYDL